MGGDFMREAVVDLVKESGQPSLPLSGSNRKPVGLVFLLHI